MKRNFEKQARLYTPTHTHRNLYTMHVSIENGRYIEGNIEGSVYEAYVRSAFVQDERLRETRVCFLVRQKNKNKKEKFAQTISQRAVEAVAILAAFFDTVGAAEAIICKYRYNVVNAYTFI